MQVRSGRFSLLGIAAWLCAAGWGACAAAQGSAPEIPPELPLTPESPIVREAVARGVEYLKRGEADSPHPGAWALAGLAMVRQGVDPNHPTVRRHTEAIVERVRAVEDPRELDFGRNGTIYSAGLCIMYLVELDPQLYYQEIEDLLALLVHRQKVHGGWGYPERDTGDTSMVQYAILGIWTARQAGFAYPFESIEAGATWLLRVQHRNGGYPYQGRVAPSFEPIAQPDFRPSLGPAGVGSLYLAVELLRRAGEIDSGRDSSLPPALREVNQVSPSRTRLDQRLFQAAIARGNQWIEERASRPHQHVHYYLYSVERYWAFREMDEGPMGASPPWYNDGARFLLERQRPEGQWVGSAGTMCDTAFSILFLTRSTRRVFRTVRDFGDGTLRGGRGLPADSDRVQIRDGEIISESSLTAADQLLALLEDTSGEGFDRALRALTELPPQESRALLSEHALRFRRLVSGRDPAARTAAIRALGLSGELENAPTLIYALSDPDPAVAREAVEALRRLSRRFDAPSLSRQPTEGERQRVIRDWRQWYLAIDPDANLDQ